ncbi:hypothetical protein C8R45DRAFT_965364 [Mycena sanguinolenta]|nr:hypothetical protein C8R45DRAFT_965364 [Mycena sanguinolenta]
MTVCGTPDTRNRTTRSTRNATSKRTISDSISIRIPTKLPAHTAIITIRSHGRHHIHGTDPTRRTIVREWCMLERAGSGRGEATLSAVHEHAFDVVLVRLDTLENGIPLGCDKSGVVRSWGVFFVVVVFVPFVLFARLAVRIPLASIIFMYGTRLFRPNDTPVYLVIHHHIIKSLRRGRSGHMQQIARHADIRIARHRVLHGTHRVRELTVTAELPGDVAPSFALVVPKDVVPYTDFQLRGLEHDASGIDGYTVVRIVGIPRFKAVGTKQKRADFAESTGSERALLVECVGLHWFGLCNEPIGREHHLSVRVSTGGE